MSREWEVETVGTRYAEALERTLALLLEFEALRPEDDWPEGEFREAPVFYVDYDETGRRLVCLAFGDCPLDAAEKAKPVILAFNAMYPSTVLKAAGPYHSHFGGWRAGFVVEGVLA